MNPFHYPQVTRPRSRSPSPNFQRFRENVEDDSEAFPNQCCNSNHLSEETGRQSRTGDRNLLGSDLISHERRLRPESRDSRRSRADEARRESRSGSVLHCECGNRLNDSLQHNDHLLAEDSHRHWRKRYRTCSCPRDGDKELLVRHARSSSHMDEPSTNSVPNYGSVNDEGQPLLRGCDSDGARGGGDSDSTHQNFKKKCHHTPAMVDELRKRNQLYFMDPITKLLYFHGFPWKLTFQIIKVVLITIQVLVFGGQRENIVEYFERSELAYRNLLLQDWGPGYETMPYPPASGQYAIYSRDDLSDHLNYAVRQYYALPEKTLASVYHNKDNVTSDIKPVVLCYSANSYIDFANGSHVVTGNIIKECIPLKPACDPSNCTFDILDYLQSENITIPFNRTVEIELKMQFRTFHLNLVETHYGPSCYNVSLTIVYENTDRSGQLVVDMVMTPMEIDCRSHIDKTVLNEMDDRRVKVTAFDVVVMCVCAISTILCSRSLSRSNKLRRITATYFRECRGKSFRFSSQMEYINLWYVAIILNDIFTIVGSALKIQLESRVFSISSENYAICSIFLGLGIFLSYVSILRYLSFFKSYNVLILTLKTSFPHVVRFLVCAICLYTGFLFCGWVVFSPYHIKFRRLSTASECLYSLVNGDDMFVTFSALTNNSAPIWYFHRAYLYIFISIFIYVVLSVFIAVIMDNYEKLKFYYEKGFPDSDIQRFINEEGELLKSELFSHVKRGTRCQRWFFCFFPCLSCLRRDPKRSKVARDHRQLLATI